VVTLGRRRRGRLPPSPPPAPLPRSSRLSSCRRVHPSRVLVTVYLKEKEETATTATMENSILLNEKGKILMDALQPQPSTSKEVQPSSSSASSAPALLPSQDTGASSSSASVPTGASPIYLDKLIKSTFPDINAEKTFHAVDSMLSHAFITVIQLLCPTIDINALLRIDKNARSLFHGNPRAKHLEHGAIALSLYIALRRECKSSFMSITPKQIANEFHIDPQLILLAETQLLFSPEAASDNGWHPAPSEYITFILNKLKFPPTIINALEEIIKTIELNYYGAITPSGLIYYTTYFVLVGYVHPTQCPDLNELLVKLTQSLNYTPNERDVPNFFQTVLVHNIIMKYELHKPKKINVNTQTK
jgi:hypothetical protein